MSLENTLCKFKRKVISSILATGLGLAVLGCSPEIPGPISVKNSIIPSTFHSGDNVEWKVSVTNNGTKIKIGKVYFTENIKMGGAVEYRNTEDLPVQTGYEVPAHSTTVIFDKFLPAYNPYSYDLTFENTVTVNSDGGNASDTTNYTILHH